MPGNDADYSGSIPEVYERNLVPALFVPYATDIADRATVLQPQRVVELAAGTGVVTRALARALPAAHIEATDISESMIELACSRTDSPNVRWCVADAQNLPFADAIFDLAVCQFGIMFFPERVHAFSEVNRVLAPGGSFLFSVWEDLHHNDVARIISQAAAFVFSKDPPTFLERVPYGRGDVNAITRDLQLAGFSNIRHDVVRKPTGAVSLRDAATGFCQGTPLWHEITKRDASQLDNVIEEATGRLRDAFRNEQVAGTMSAFVFTAN